MTLTSQSASVDDGNEFSVRVRLFVRWKTWKATDGTRRVMKSRID